MTLNYEWDDVEEYQLMWLRVLYLCERTWVRVYIKLYFFFGIFGFGLNMERLKENPSSMAAEGWLENREGLASWKIYPEREHENLEFCEV